MFAKHLTRFRPAWGLSTAACLSASVALRWVSHSEGQAAPIPTVYQYQICPYCHRVKAYLDYLKVPYEVIEVNPLTKSELSSISPDYKKVPIVNFGGTVVKDSSAIVQYIREHNSQPESFFPSDSDKWTEWSEKRLAVLLYPNITRTKEECWECFAYASEVSSWNGVWRGLVRTIGPLAMSFANGRIKKKYGIEDERKELRTALEEWCAALGDKKFLHGDTITLPDLMVYGVLRSISGFQTFREVIAENEVLRQWYERVSEQTASQEVCVLRK